MLDISIKNFITIFLLTAISLVTLGMIGGRPLHRGRRRGDVTPVNRGRRRGDRAGGDDRGISFEQTAVGGVSLDFDFDW